MEGPDFPTLGVSLYDSIILSNNYPLIERFCETSFSLD